MVLFKKKPFFSGGGAGFVGHTGSTTEGYSTSSQNGEVHAVNCLGTAVASPIAQHESGTLRTNITIERATSKQDRMK